MKKILFLNILICAAVCITIIACEWMFNDHIVNTILLAVYFSLPIGMIILTIAELSLYKKHMKQLHIINIIKFDLFFILAILSLVVEVAKALNITLKIGLNEMIAGLATLVALDRVLIYAKIAFEKKIVKNDSEALGDRSNAEN